MLLLEYVLPHRLMRTVDCEDAASWWWWADRLAPSSFLETTSTGFGGLSAASSLRDASKWDQNDLFRGHEGVIANMTNIDPNLTLDYALTECRPRLARPWWSSLDYGWSLRNSFLCPNSYSYCPPQPSSAKFHWESSRGYPFRKFPTSSVSPQKRAPGGFPIRDERWLVGEVEANTSTIVTPYSPLSLAHL